MLVALQRSLTLFQLSQLVPEHDRKRFESGASLNIAPLQTGVAALPLLKPARAIFIQVPWFLLAAACPAHLIQKIPPAGSSFLRTRAHFVEYWRNQYDYELPENAEEEAYVSVQFGEQTSVLTYVA